MKVTSGRYFNKFYLKLLEFQYFDRLRALELTPEVNTSDNTKIHTLV